jgi:glucosamine-6-phosphate isomerase
MKVSIYKDYETLSRHAAEIMFSTLQQSPKAVYCVATGDSPKLTYQYFVERIKSTQTDPTALSLIALDEWIGIPPDNEGSCHWFLHHYLIQPLGLKPDQVNLFNALSSNREEECRKADSFIQQKGGIDLMVVGVGMNGHIGFNEPGADLQQTAHVAELAPITRSVGQKYFKGKTELQYGFTVGLKQVMECRKLLVLASGEKKAGIMHQAIEGTSSVQCPASLVQQHKQGIVLLDEGAASGLDRKKLPIGSE